MLTLRGASKQFGPHRALQPLDLDLEPRRTTVLIGPSGSGKSTVLRLLIGLVAPDTGSVAVDGVPVTADTVLEVRRRMGYVIQAGGLFPHLSAADNITLMARFTNMPLERRRARVQELAALTRFPPGALPRFPAQLSGGQRQRVSLMRALMLDPAVLLLDEPLGALDPITRSELQEDLKRIFSELGKTVVLVTHDLAEAAFFGDTIVLMRDGCVVQEGSVADLMTDPADEFVRRFVRAQRSLHHGFEDGEATP